MNVNSMYQLMGAIQKNPQVVGEAVAAGAGVGFEDMLQQASQKPANAADKKPAQNNGDKTGSKPTDSAEKNPQNTQDKPEASGTQNVAGNQTAGAQDTEEAQAIAAALAYGAGQPLPVINLVGEEANAETAPVIVLDAETPSAAINVNAEQTSAQSQGGFLPQQNTATAAQTMPQAEAMPQNVTVQEEQPVVANPQQTAAVQIEQQPQLGAAQPEFKQAEGGARAQNVMTAQPGQTEESGENGENVAAAAQTPIFSNAEAVPVKVMEAEQPLDPQADDAAEQLAQKINQALAQGESRITLNLTPANLGSLTVEISRLADGTLSVILSAVTEKAAGLLDKHSGSLQSLLAGNMPGGNVRVDVENRTPEENAQQFLNPDQQERGGREQNDDQQNRQQQAENTQAVQADFMQQLRLGLISLDE